MPADGAPAAAAAGPEDAYAAPADERRTDDTDYGFDEFGFEMEDDEVYAKRVLQQAGQQHLVVRARLPRMTGPPPPPARPPARARSLARTQR